MILISCFILDAAVGEKDKGIFRYLTGSIINQTQMSFEMLYFRIFGREIAVAITP